MNETTMEIIVHEVRKSYLVCVENKKMDMKRNPKI